MKKVLFFAAVLGAIFTVKAQSISTLYNDSIVNEGDTIVFETSETEPLVHTKFYNNTDATIHAIIRCETVNATGMAVSAMCAGQCQQGSVSPEFSIEGNSTYTGFFADFVIEENLQNGASGLFKFVTYNTADSTDASKVFLKIVVKKNAINAISTSKELSAYPNPTYGKLTVKYTLPEGNTNGKIVLYNLLGCVVREINVSSAQGSVEFNVNSLPAGIYMYGLVAGGKQSTLKKLSIQ